MTVTINKGCSDASPQVVTGRGLEEVLADRDHKSGGRAITLASLFYWFGGLQSC